MRSRGGARSAAPPFAPLVAAIHAPLDTGVTGQYLTGRCYRSVTQAERVVTPTRSKSMFQSLSAHLSHSRAALAIAGSLLGAALANGPTLPNASTATARLAMGSSSPARSA